MDFPDEYLLQVKGTTGTVDGVPAITSLTIVTSRKTHGPFGSVQGKKFQSSREGKVVGFFGQASNILHQLGVITLIVAAPDRGQCTRCQAQYVYCCKCTLPKQSLPGSSSREVITTTVIDDGYTRYPGGYTTTQTLVTPGTREQVPSSPDHVDTSSDEKVTVTKTGVVSGQPREPTKPGIRHEDTAGQSPIPKPGQEPKVGFAPLLVKKLACSHSLNLEVKALVPGQKYGCVGTVRDGLPVTIEDRSRDAYAARFTSALAFGRCGEQGPWDNLRS